MGNLCGKESSQDNFSQPGRTLSSAPPQSNTATAPLPKKIGGAPRTLGGGSASKEPQTTAQQESARKKAAEAAEARANAANKTKGKLGSQLQSQKKQTRNDTLDSLSKEERRIRDADASAEARAYN